WGMSTGQGRIRVWWLPKVGGLLLIFIVAVGLFFSLWPAMWVDPIGTLSLTFGKLFTDQAAGKGNLGLFWLGQFVEDPGPGFYPVAFILKSTPWLLLGLLLSIIQLFSRNAQTEANDLAQPGLTNPGHSGQQEAGEFDNPPGVEKQLSTPKIQTLNPKPRTLNPETISLWLFALTYLLIMTVASKKSIRYMMPAFPAFYLLAGLAYHQVW
ncbi:MAG: hypothetical protein GY796_37145, partial [Chloroflexi bacterium]|nr:hypothetical protein [Chloroflexota bacterium]